jgi:hypothetical protein
MPKSPCASNPNFEKWLVSKKEGQLKFVRRLHPTPELSERNLIKKEHQSG